MENVELVCKYTTLNKYAVLEMITEEETEIRLNELKKGREDALYLNFYDCAARHLIRDYGNDLKKLYRVRR